MILCIYLAQWGDQKIVTNFTNKTTFEKIEDVNQDLLTESNSYPITYKVRKSGEGWKIINIIVNGVNLGQLLETNSELLRRI